MLMLISICNYQKHKLERSRSLTLTLISLIPLGLGRFSGLGKWESRHSPSACRCRRVRSLRHPCRRRRRCLVVVLLLLVVLVVLVLVVLVVLRIRHCRRHCRRPICSPPPPPPTIKYLLHLLLLRRRFLSPHPHPRRCHPPWGSSSSSNLNHHLPCYRITYSFSACPCPSTQQSLVKNNQAN